MRSTSAETKHLNIQGPDPMQHTSMTWEEGTTKKLFKDMDEPLMLLSIEHIIAFSHFIPSRRLGLIREPVHSERELANTCGKMWCSEQSVLGQLGERGVYSLADQGFLFGWG